MPSVISPAKLYKAIDAADDRLRRPRELRRTAFKEFVGRYYAEDDGKQRPMNLVYRACKVYQAHIAYRSPKYEVRTDDPTIRGEAVVLGELISNLADEMDFSALDRLLLLDALLGPRAVVRMGMKAGSDAVTQEGRDLNPGQWYLRRISLDDHLTDPRANRREEMAWEGDRYRVGKQALLDSGVFDNAVIERLPTMPVRSRDGVGRAEDLSGRKTQDEYDLIDTVELVDVFFYDAAGGGRTVKATLPTEFEADVFLREEEYEGPERGPYEWLEFDPLPDNLNSLPPVAGYREQSENVNNVLAKLIEQIGKSKRIPVVGDDTPEDEVDAIKANRDGEVLRARDPKAANVLDLSFVSPELVPMGQMLLTFANIQAGNPDMMGGTGSNAKTATEFQGLMTTAGAMTDLLVDIHDGFWSRVGRHGMWYLVRDPLIRRGTTKRIGGFEVQLVYDAEQREGDFEDFRLKVRPRSTVRMDENVRGRRLVELLSLVPGLVQTEMMTMGGFSSMGAVRVLGRRFGEDELDEMFRDPELIRQAALKYGAIAPPTQGVPKLAGVTPGRNTQTRSIDAGRSAMSAAVPA